jgi:hypothetical protein
MRPKRILAQDAWYEVRTAINNHKPLFRRQQAIAVFCRVFGEARGRFAFELRGLRLKEEWLSFYIRPVDGLQLPAIMQWLKQTFSVRFNLQRGRSGHVRGDRYWSRVLEGEPPEEAGEVDWAAVEVAAETADCVKTHNGTGGDVVEYRQEGGHGIHYRKKPQSDSITAGQ